MPLSTRVDINIGASLTSSLDLNSSPTVQLAKALALSLADGALAGQAQQLWFDKRTILASANDDLDLTGGALTNGLGAQVNLVRVKMIFVYSLPANVNDIHVGAGSNPLVNWVGAAGDIVVVKPGGCFLTYAPDLAGFAVTAGTGDILRVTNAAGGTSVDYEIVVVGTNS